MSNLRHIELPHLLPFLFVTLWMDGSFVEKCRLIEIHYASTRSNKWFFIETVKLVIYVSQYFHHSADLQWKGKNLYRIKSHKLFHSNANDANKVFFREMRKALLVAVFCVCLSFHPPRNKDLKMQKRGRKKKFLPSTFGTFLLFSSFLHVRGKWKSVKIVWQIGAQEKFLINIREFHYIVDNLVSLLNGKLHNL